MAPGTVPLTDFLLALIPTKRAKRKYIPDSDEDWHISITKGIGALVETDNEEERSCTSTHYKVKPTISHLTVIASLPLKRKKVEDVQNRDDYLDYEISEREWRALTNVTCAHLMG
jgi:hypothetical protein